MAFYNIHTLKVNLKLLPVILNNILSYMFPLLCVFSSLLIRDYIAAIVEVYIIALFYFL